MALNSMQDLLVSELRDLYSAERQLIQALPKMASASSNQDLREALTNHLEETREHALRLENACKQLGVTPTGKTCKGMAGLVAEGSEVLEENGETPIRDAAIISAAQRVEHYEIAAYGSAVAFADLLGEDEIVDLLKDTLKEEGAADKKLTKIAESDVNEAAMEVGSAAE